MPDSKSKQPPTAATNLIGSSSSPSPIPHHLSHWKAFMLTYNATTAGGGAGMMEALACHPLGQFPTTSPISHTQNHLKS
ncbi:hypothetical protein V8C26DRAFT_389890 [Trichoderma gracile]